MGYPQLGPLWLLLSSPINACLCVSSPDVIATSSSPFTSRFVIPNALIIVLITIFISCVRPPCWLFLLHPDFLFLSFVVASCFLFSPLSPSSPSSSSSSSSTSFLWLVCGIEEMASMFGGLLLVHRPPADGSAGGHQDILASFVSLTRNS